MTHGNCRRFHSTHPALRSPSFTPSPASTKWVLLAVRPCVLACHGCLHRRVYWWYLARAHEHQRSDHLTRFVNVGAVSMNSIIAMVRAVVDGRTQKASPAKAQLSSGVVLLG